MDRNRCNVRRYSCCGDSCIAADCHHAGHFAENGSGISCQRDWSECRNCGNSRSPCKKGRMEAICFCWFLLWSFGHSVGRKSRSNQFFTGDGQEMRVLAGVVLGGCSLSGGKGSFLGCYLGVLFLTIIDNAINLIKYFFVLGTVSAGNYYFHCDLA